MRSPFSAEVSLGGSDGGIQVATVKASTNFRMKYLGKVPPRLLTLCCEKLAGYVIGVEKGDTYVARRVM